MDCTGICTYNNSRAVSIKVLWVFCLDMPKGEKWAGLILQDLCESRLLGGGKGTGIVKTVASRGRIDKIGEADYVGDGVKVLRVS
jgi:hypothetical protein